MKEHRDDGNYTLDEQHPAGPPYNPETELAALRSICEMVIEAGEKAADRIERQGRIIGALQGAFRVNILRLAPATTHAEIDAILAECEKT